MIKRKGLAFSLTAAVLLSNPALLTNEASAASPQKATVTATKLEQLTVKDLNSKSKATLNHVKDVIPAIKKYGIDSIIKENIMTNSGTIERLEIILSGTPEGTNPNFGVVHLNSSTGELLSVELQNGLPSSKKVIDEKEAFKKGKEHLKRLFGEQAESYKFSEIHSSTSQDNQTQILVKYKSPDHSIYVTMNSVGELQTVKKDIYSEAKLEGKHK
ncbi:hypothetical protein ACFYU8_26785 [Brevibacillus sp. NPDC003359]|uniref:hypothetical protein n=1 Tax=unclassified Brevibacillus TaxID=2684853 RepID=UPI0036972949